MLSLPHTEFDMGNMAGVLQEADIPHSSGAPESTPGFLMGSMLLMFFSFKRCLYCFGLEFAVLRSSSVVFYKNKKIIVLRFFFFENLIFI
jgi:hypothetical protein